MWLNFKQTNMKKERFFLITFLALTLLLIFLLDHTKPIVSGKITKINIDEKQISIFLENHKELIILQNKTPINLQEFNHVKIYGKISNYQNKTIIFVDKIICLNC